MKEVVSSLSYGFYSTLFGECCVAFSGELVYALTFSDSKSEALLDLEKRFPNTHLLLVSNEAEELIKSIFEKGLKPELRPVGTDFQQQVWAALLEIPVGTTSTYADIAHKIGKPKAIRAVGTAIGANPIAFLIPCHRVLRTDGGLGGFRWGLDCKKKMLKNEGVLL